MSAPSEYPGTPRWVKITALGAALIIVLFAVVLHTGLGGRHGPGLHRIDRGSLPPNVPADHR